MHALSHPLIYFLISLFIFQVEQWKAEANNSERQRQRMEAAYMNLQVTRMKATA